MKVNLNIILTMLTHRKLCENEEWGMLQTAEGLLISEVARAFEGDDPTKIYDPYAKETRDLITSYLLEAFPELNGIYNLLAPEANADKMFEIIDAMRPTLPAEFEVTPIPVDFKAKGISQK